MDNLLLNKIICGDALTELKKMPNDLIDCVVCSPPYWGLRDYQTEGQIWDGDEKCKHIWNKRNFKLHSGRGDAQKSGKYSEQEPIPDKELSDHFCSLCNAWCGSLGLEPTFKLYIKHLCDIFDEVKRVLKKTGTCWVNLGDTYNSQIAAPNPPKLGKRFDRYYEDSKKFRNEALKRIKLQQKCLLQIPSRFSIEMCDRNWILRNTLIWHKPNCMPSSANDRFTVDFEYVFFFAKNKKYWFERQFEDYALSSDVRYRQRLRANAQYNLKEPYKKNMLYYKAGQGSVKSRGQHKDHLCVGGYEEKGRNKRSVWTINTKPFKEAHFAVFPEELIATPIKAGCPKSGIVLDPFMGSGTVAVVAKRLNRKWLGIELNSEYIKIAKKRLANTMKNLF